MREIRVDLIRDCVARLCQEANFLLPPDIQEALHDAAGRETSPAGQAVLDDLLKNAALARNGRIPICQDTGMAVVFAEIGQEVHITGGWFEDAIRQGVAQGYTTGYLRPSIVSDPLLRRNTGDNTPPVIHTRIVPGDQMHLTVAPKGFGSENMSAARMLSPSEGTDGIRRFVLETVEKAGSNPCPPVVIGIGLGGTLEKAALLAKQALLLPSQAVNEQSHLAELEKDLLQAVNDLGIGPGGLGGKVTALALHILAWPTHIAGLPIVLNMGCHATRHAEAYL